MVNRATEVDWPTLIEERNAWVAYNFPKNQGDGHIPIQSTMGVIEEMGELTHAHLKSLQNIRGSEEEHIANGKDAIGDMMVYLMGVMNYTGLEPRPLPRGRLHCGDPDEAIMRIATVVGTLALRVQDFPRSKPFIADSVDRVVHCAYAYCFLREWDFVEIVTTTWAGVKKRDWIKYPDTGLPPLVGASPQPKHDEACMTRKRLRPYLCTCGMSDADVAEALA